MDLHSSRQKLDFRMFSFCLLFILSVIQNFVCTGFARIRY